MAIRLKDENDRLIKDDILLTIKFSLNNHITRIRIILAVKILYLNGISLSLSSKMH